MSNSNGNGVRARRGGMIKIGQVARDFDVSLDLLRLYEREGLLISLRSQYGTRYFTHNDYRWISMLLRLMREARMNCASLRRLLALAPCWEHRHCAPEQMASCPVASEQAGPCWSQCPECEDNATCYVCPVYRAAPDCQQLKALLEKPDLPLAPIASAVPDLRGST